MIKWHGKDYRRWEDALQEQADEIERRTEAAKNYAAAAMAKQQENERLRAALERIEAMSERPKCVCGRPTGTAAIKACAREALQENDDV